MYSALSYRLSIPFFKKNRGGGGQKEYVVSNKNFINQKNKSIYNKFFSGPVHSAHSTLV